MALTVTVNGPLGEPANVVPTVTAGGTLAASTTYYFKVFAGVRTTAGSAHYPAPHRKSPEGTEYTFTTTVTDKSVSITWDAVTDATHYNIYLTTTSGVYSNSSRVGSISTTPTATTNSKIISSPATTSSWDTFTSAQTCPESLDLNLGKLTIQLSGTATSDPLQEIKDAINTAGYSGYCYYDKHMFVLLGSIHVSGTTSGSMVVTKRVLHFISGTIINTNVNFYMQFGNYDAATNVVSAGCTIAVNSWLPAIITQTYLRFYGCFFVQGTFDTSDGVLWADADGSSSAGGSWHDFRYGTSLFNTFMGIIMDNPHPDSTIIGGFCYPRVNNQTITRLKSITGGLQTDYCINHASSFVGNVLEDSEIYAAYNHINTSLPNAESMVLRDNNFYDENGVLMANNKPRMRYTAARCGVMLNQKSIILKIVEDETETPIEGVLAVLVNNAGTQQFSLTSDSSGNTTKTYVTHAQYDHHDNGGGTYTAGSDKDTAALTDTTDYNPFVLTLTKTGYDTLKITFDLTQKQPEWVLKMKRRRRVR